MSKSIYSSFTVEGEVKRIRNGDAVGYLQRAAQDPLTAAFALGELAGLRVEGTLQLCDQALALPGVLGADVIRERRAKLIRQLAKKQGTRSHVTIDSIPDDLKEWSSNLDGCDLPKVLRTIQKCVQGGFAKAEAEMPCESSERSMMIEVERLWTSAATSRWFSSLASRLMGAADPALQRGAREQDSACNLHAARNEHRRAAVSVAAV